MKGLLSAESIQGLQKLDNLAAIQATIATAVPLISNATNKVKNRRSRSPTQNGGIVRIGEGLLGNSSKPKKNK